MKKVIIILVLVLVLLAAVGYRLYRIRSEPVVLSMADLQAEQGMPVLVYEVTAEDYRRTVGVSGGVLAYDTSIISPQVAERVVEVHVDAGDLVEEGDLLVTLDSTVCRLRVAQGEAALSRAESNLERLENGSRPEEIAAALAAMQRAEANRNLMEIELNRQRSLYEEDATTLQHVQRAENEFRISEADLSSARANYDLIVAGPRDEDLAIARAERDLALIDLADCRENADDHVLRSPRRGVVTYNLLAAGDMVEVNQSILKVLYIDQVYLKIDLSELYVPLVRVGMAVEVTIDALGDEVFVGTLHEINPLAEDVGRSFRVLILLDNADHRLLPGMFGRAHIVTAEALGALTVPADCLRSDDAGSYVFVVDEESKAQRRDVVVGETFGDRMEIIEGLSNGDVVVALGRSALEVGEKVYVTNDGDGDDGAVEGEW